MNTVESPMIRELWDRIRANLGDSVVMFGGSVPNLSTELSHSYHRSWDDSPHDDGYSVHYPGDRRKLWTGSTRNLSCALDVSFHRSEDIQKYTARLHHFCMMQPHVHRRIGLREFAGTMDGETVFAYDTTIHARTYGWALSHLYHHHLSFNRRYVNSPRILRLADVYKP